MKKNKWNLEKTPEMEKSHFRAKLLTGLFVITFGVLYLLWQMDIEFPRVLISWEIILIMAGFVSLVKHNFKKTFGYVLIVVGGLFMINDFYPYTIQTRFIWPVLIILLGISIFIKAATRSKKKNSCATNFNENPIILESDDYIVSSAVFSGVTRNVVSKNFKGGNVSSVFGGTELNFTNSDIESKAIIDVSCVFGGVTIIVPSNWKVQSEMSTVFGGVDDKRQLSLLQEDENKLLILRGDCVFGGVEISSYK